MRTTSPRKPTKASLAAAAQTAAREAHNRRVALSNLGHRAARVRSLTYAETCNLLAAMEAGTVNLTEAGVNSEIEAFLPTVRCHEDCKSWVRQYGYAPYKSPKDPTYHLDATLCEVCARPLGCTNTDGKHTYQELSQSECRAKGLYHAGNCYHVSVCTGCGHVYSVDSSG